MAEVLRQHRAPLAPAPDGPHARAGGELVQREFDDDRRTIEVAVRQLDVAEGTRVSVEVAGHHLADLEVAAGNARLLAADDESDLPQVSEGDDVIVRVVEGEQLEPSGAVEDADDVPVLYGVVRSS